MGKDEVQTSSRSRSLVLKKGKTSSVLRFQSPPSQHSEKPVKGLGKLFNWSLRDTAAIKRTCGDPGVWLTKADKFELPSRFKAWIYQHAVLPRVLWPL